MTPVSELPQESLDAIAHGADASEALRQAVTALDEGGVDAAAEYLGKAIASLSTFQLAVHLVEAKLAVGRRQFGAAVEAHLAARNCFNRLPREEQTLYLESLRAVEKEIGATDFGASLYGR